MKTYYITFRSVTFAQRGEQVLKEAGVRCGILRTPKWMEAQGCGYSLRVWAGDIHGILELLREKKVHLRKTYLQKQDGTLEELAI